MVYEPICKPNQLIIGEGEHVAIVTGWTPKEKVAKMLNPKDYAVIGNLYNAARGIPFLIRNLLANPFITDVIAVNATKQDNNSGSIDCLHEMFILDDLEYAPKDIPEEEITYLLDSVIYNEVDSIKELKLLLDKMPTGKIIRKKQVFFPPDQEDSNLALASVYGHKIEALTIAEAWVKITHRIRRNGRLRPTGYDGQWQELINLEVVIKDEPSGFFTPDYLPGDRQSIEDYLPQILDDAPYQDGVKYTYGQRLRSWFGKDQIQQVINKLVKEPDSASAVMNLWDSGTGSGDGAMFTRVGRKIGDSDHDHGGSPCLNHIWVRIVPTNRGKHNPSGELTLIATLRSNDMYLAWPYNAFGLRALQEHIYSQIFDKIPIALSMGKLITQSQSAHIYDDCFDSADRLIANQYKQIIKEEMLQFNSTVGNFLISHNQAEILVEQTDPQGHFAQAYTGVEPLNLVRCIIAENPSITPTHAAYLGTEIERAAIYLKAHWDYEQDKK